MKHRTSVSTIFVLFDLNVVTNKSYKTKTYLLHWCVHSLV